MPGITTIAKARVVPATKEHNSADEIKDISMNIDKHKAFYLKASILPIVYLDQF